MQLKRYPDALCCLQKWKDNAIVYDYTKQSKPVSFLLVFVSGLSLHSYHLSPFLFWSRVSMTIDLTGLVDDAILTLAEVCQQSCRPCPPFQFKLGMQRLMRLVTPGSSTSISPKISVSTRLTAVVLCIALLIYPQA